MNAFSDENQEQMILHIIWSLRGGPEEEQQTPCGAQCKRLDPDKQGWMSNKIGNLYRFRIIPSTLELPICKLPQKTKRTDYCNQSVAARHLTIIQLYFLAHTPKCGIVELQQANHRTQGNQVPDLALKKRYLTTGELDIVGVLHIPIQN